MNEQRKKQKKILLLTSPIYHVLPSVQLKSVIGYLNPSTSLNFRGSRSSFVTSTPWRNLKRPGNTRLHVEVAADNSSASSSTKGIGVCSCSSRGSVQLQKLKHRMKMTKEDTRPDWKRRSRTRLQFFLLIFLKLAASKKRWNFLFTSCQQQRAIVEEQTELWEFI